MSQASRYVFHTEGSATPAKARTVNFALSGAGGEIVAAVAASKLVIVSFAVWHNHSGADGKVIVKAGGSGGTTLIPQYDAALHQRPLVLPWNPEGHGEGAAGENLFLQIVGGTTPDFRGVLSYLVAGV